MRDVDHRLVPLTAADEWDAALAGVPHAFAHTRGSCLAMRRTSGLETVLYVGTAGDTRVVCPLALRTLDGRTDVVTPYGFGGFTGTGPAPGFADAWPAFARAQGWVAGYLALNPLFAQPSYVHADALVPAADLFVLDLVSPPAELHARLDANRRRQLRRWDEQRARIVTDREPLAAFLVEHLRAFLRSKDAGPAYAFSDATIATLTNLDDVLLAGWDEGGRLEAVSVFGHTPDAADYLFNVSLPEGRRHAVPLVWHAVHELRARGVPSLNLGGAVRPGDGVGRFKERFGAERVPFGALKQVYDEDAYAALCRAHGADPGDREGWFPAYRAPA